jgi:hypothetical protein
VEPLQAYLAKPWRKFYRSGVPPEVEIDAKPVFQLFDDAAAAGVVVWQYVLRPVGE